MNTETDKTTRNKKTTITKPRARKASGATKSEPGIALARIESVTLTRAALDDAITKINSNKKLLPGDRRAMLDKLLAAFPHMDRPANVYETEWYVVPGGRLRAISISGQTIKENESTDGPKFFWPLVDVYEVGSLNTDDLRYASPLRIYGDDMIKDRGFDPYARQIVTFRHVEILGPSFVNHDPERPIDGLARRAAAMYTSAPLRLHADTVEQAKLNGKGHREHRRENATGKFGC